MSARTAVHICRTSDDIQHTDGATNEYLQWHRSRAAERRLVGAYKTIP
ncbi:hypothetical protein [Nocardia sp. CA-120079]